VNSRFARGECADGDTAYQCKQKMTANGASGCTAHHVSMTAAGVAAPVIVNCNAEGAFFEVHRCTPEPSNECTFPDTEWYNARYHKCASGTAAACLEEMQAHENICKPGMALSKDGNGRDRQVPVVLCRAPGHKFELHGCEPAKFNKCTFPDTDFYRSRYNFCSGSLTADECLEQMATNGNQGCRPGHENNRDDSDLPRVLCLEDGGKFELHNCVPAAGNVCTFPDSKHYNTHYNKCEGALTAQQCVEQMLAKGNFGCTAGHELNRPDDIKQPRVHCTENGGVFEMHNCVAAAANRCNFPTTKWHQARFQTCSNGSTMAECLEQMKNGNGGCKAPFVVRSEFDAAQVICRGDGKLFEVYGCVEA